MRPFGQRDFTLLWAGMAISLLGDGVYLVAIAWQVYEIADATAFAMVGVAWTLPQLVFLLVGGVATDRFDRRKVLIASDLMRGASVLAIGALSVAGTIQVWHLVVLVAVYGIGEAFFAPAFGAIVPELVPEHLLAEANSVDQFVRPVAWRFLGPAIGGFMIAGVGVGSAFMLDAVTFAASALCVALIRPLPRQRDGETALDARKEIVEGYRFVRSQRWLWITIVAAGVAQFAFFGPFQILLPKVIKDVVGGSAADLGVALSAGGVGSIIAAVVMAQRGLPRHHITWVYLGWGIGCLGLVGFALSSQLWQVMATAFGMMTLFTIGIIVWSTLLHRFVPAHMMGRVFSLDWLLSSALIPLSYLAGPISNGIGVDATLIGAGAMGCVTMLLFLAVPGVRTIER